MKRIREFINSDMGKKVLPEVKRAVATIIFTLVYGVGVSWFLEASVVPLYTGGVPGIAQLIRDALYVWFDIDIDSISRMIFSGMLILFNIPVLLIAWFGVSKKFAIYSLLSILIQATVIGLIPVVDMGLSSETHALAAAIVGGVLIGVGAGGTLKYGTSTGGLDIVAQYFAFKKGKSVGYISLLLNGTIAVLGGLIVNGHVFNGVEVVGGVVISYTIIRIIITTMAMDKLHTSYQYIAVEVITEIPQKMADEILSTVYRGVTLSKVEGAYSHHEKTMVYVVILSYELNLVLELIKKTDPHAFVVTQPVKSIMGNFKRKTIA